MEINGLLPANKIFKDVINDYSKPDLVLYGSASSGKSEMAFSSELIKFITIPGYNVMVGRKKRNTVKKSIFPLIKKNINRLDNIIYEQKKIRPYHEIIKFNHTDLIIENTQNENMMFGFGMNDEEQLENVKSITAKNGEIQAIVMEESSQNTEDDYNQLNARLRGKLPDNFVIKTKGRGPDIQIRKRITMLLNPIYMGHWIKKKYQITDDGKGRAYSRNGLATVLKTTYKDNRFLEPEDHARLERYKETSPYFYQVYCLGNWGVLSDHDVVIPYHLIHKILDLEIEPEGEMQVGVDVGRFGDDPSVIYTGQGPKPHQKKVIPICDGPELAAHTIAEIKEVRSRHNLGNLRVNVKVDITGVGSSCGDILHKYACQHPEFNMVVYEINFGSTQVKEPDRFPNIITEMYYELKEKIKNCEVDFDQKRDQQAIDELSQRSYVIDNKTSFPKVEPKDKFKEKLGGTGSDESDSILLYHYSPLRQLSADSVRVIKKQELDIRLGKKFGKSNFDMRKRDGKHIIK